MFLKLLCVILILITTVHTENEKFTDNLINSIDVLDKEDSIYLFSGLSIVKSKIQDQQRNEIENETLQNRIKRFLECHEIQFKVPADEEQLVEGKLLYIYKYVYFKMCPEIHNRKLYLKKIVFKQIFYTYRL